MKNKLNYELLERHIREAAGELNSLLNSIQFMLNRLEKAGELQVDARRNLNEGGLEVSLAHAYHHMNFALFRPPAAGQGAAVRSRRSGLRFSSKTRLRSGRPRKRTVDDRQMALPGF